MMKINVNRQREERRKNEIGERMAEKNMLLLNVIDNFF